MNYLFFDIECACHIGGIAKICSFGYVLCDSDFNVIEKKDILINPVSAFSREFFEDGAEFFAYPAEQFYAQPAFDTAYSEIRRLLTDQSNILIGHAAACDTAYLSQNISDYGLEHFDFTYLDTQKMHAFFTSESRLALEKLCEIYGVTPLRAHKSDDDAEMTLFVTKSIVEKYGLTPEEMLKNKSLIGVCHGGAVHDNLISAFPLADAMLLTPAEKILFRKYLSETVTAEREVPGVTGVKFIFDEAYEHRSFSKALYVTDLIRKCGGKYTVSSLDADVFVFCSDKTPRGVRYRSAVNKNKPVISLFSLLSRLETDKSRFAGAIDTDAIFGSTEESKDWYMYYHKHFALKSTQN
ncbi:MAG: 3'-5' exonuclease [Ruminococcaceae bacterium]|nr:3'-5' exonuclease [Oscillospiraceae bacterium]